MELSLESIAARPPEGTYDVNLPCQVIGVLHQMRSRMSMAGLDDLAASIREMGQHTPGLVVAFTAVEAQEYLERINEMWGTTYCLEQFEPAWIQERQQLFHLFLVAGHRRLRAVEMAEVTRFYARLYFGRSFSEALLMQYHENIHEQVPPDNEARFITLFWRDEKKKNPELTLTKFARTLGKKPEVVRRSVRFTALPVRVQELVLPSQEFKKGIAFALLCELARLQEARTTEGQGFNDQELMQLAYVLVTQYRTAKAAAGWVSNQIKALQGQGEMFELSVPEVFDGARITVVSGLERSVRIGNEHLRVVARLHAETGTPRVPSGSAITAVQGALELVDNLAPQIIEGLRGGRGARRARVAVERVVGS